MKYYCTLSDKNFLAKGLALYKSLKEHSTDAFKLYYLTLDEESFNILSDLNFNEIIPISLKELEENDDLRIAKGNRPYNEYCWTLASYFSYYLLNQKLDCITYIDSDIFFYKDPKIIFDEIGTKSVGIIKHRHNIIGNKDGAYNVGVIYFKGDKTGLDVLYWWMDAVLNKKYPELQTCGDQKYLEEFIPRFGSENICVVDSTFSHGAPWNYRLYNWELFEESGDIFWGDKRQALVFNHFSRLSYNLEKDEVDPTSGQYADHTLNFQVFNIPAVYNLYRKYYHELKIIHQTWLSPKSTNILNKKLKIAFGMIVFESDYVLKECLEAIYPFASQIMIAEGPVSYWQEQGRKTSTDKTNDILNNFPDPANKLKIVHGQYTEKDEQCKAYMKFNNDKNDYIWNLDADEIFKSEDIEKIIQLLHDQKFTSIGIKPYSFYGGFDKYITGWEEKTDQFLRIFKVYPGSTWLTHRPPKIKHIQQNILQEKHLNSDILANDYGIRMYHYSYVFPRQVYNKIAYYKAAVSKHKCIDNYFTSVYVPWTTGDNLDRQMIEEAYKGVHEWKPEFRSETYTAPFIGSHPEIIIKNRDELSKKYKEQWEEWNKNGKF